MAKKEEEIEKLLSGIDFNNLTTEKIKVPNGLLKILSKRLLENAMNAEMTNHLGYEKHQRRFEGFDCQIISMYARGMTTRDIQGHLMDIY